MEWISVNDRLPEDGENVIACDKERAVCEAIYDKDGKFYWSGFWGDWCDVLEATHWMPLPEPPKEEEDATS